MVELNLFSKLPNGLDLKWWIWKENFRSLDHHWQNGGSKWSDQGGAHRSNEIQEDIFDPLSIKYQQNWTSPDIQS